VFTPRARAVGDGRQLAAVAYGAGPRREHGASLGYAPRWQTLARMARQSTRRSLRMRPWPSGNIAYVQTGFRIALDDCHESPHRAKPSTHRRMSRKLALGGSKSGRSASHKPRDTASPGLHEMFTQASVIRSRLQPSYLLPVRVSAFGSAARGSAGPDFSCAVKSDGSSWCWGRNDFGQLGNGGLSGQSAPVPVATLAMTTAEIASGSSHSCARKLDHSVWCWGWNGFGQLGDNTALDRRTPVATHGFLTSAAAPASTPLSLLILVCAVGAMLRWARGRQPSP